MPLRTLLIDNYDSYTYNLYQLLGDVNGELPTVLRNDEVDWPTVHARLEAGEFDNVVISPGPGTPQRAADVGISMALLQAQLPIPTLGVCLGFQALALAHGGTVDHAPEPVHGRLSSVRHSGHPLFEGIPSGPAYAVVRYHSLLVEEASLPACLEPIAWTCGEHHALQLAGSSGGGSTAAVAAAPGAANPVAAAADGAAANGTAQPHHQPWRRQGLQQQDGGGAVLMALAHRSLPHYGVQFHPESVATGYGLALLRNFAALTWHHRGLPVPSLPPVLLPQLAGPPGTSMPPRPWAQPQPQGNLRLHYQALPGVLAAAGGSEALFWHLFGSRSSSDADAAGAGKCAVAASSEAEAAEDTWWLDSATTDRGRFSFMGGRGGSLWRRIEYHLPPPPAAAGQLAGGSMANGHAANGLHGGSSNGSSCTGGLAVQGTLVLTAADGSVQELRTDFFGWLQDLLERQRCCVGLEEAQALPFNFWGGLVGYLGYELKAECGGSRRPAAGGAAGNGAAPAPDAAFFLADQLLAVDHYTDAVYVLALYDHGSEGSQQEARQWVAQTAEWVQALVAQQAAPGANGHGEPWPQQNGSAAAVRGAGEQPPHSGAQQQGAGTAQPAPGPFRLREGRRQYLKNVGACMQALHDGESYEVCLTTMLSRQAAPDAVQLYRTLRRVNPAPYAAWLRFGAGAPHLCCCSPERFLRGDRGGLLEAKPIKGTAPRFPSDPEADARSAAELAASEKDRAENLMIVDLLRNDLGRVCTPGSVHVPGLMQIESYATVHQMVSTVRGLRQPDASIVDCLRAAFPGGSMTGAPKIRTMEIIDKLEKGPRGVYSGSMGYISFNDTFDLNIVIRTAVLAEGRISIGAGGAIVVQSDPEGEYEEMRLKARALLRAIGECDGGGPAAVAEEDETGDKSRGVQNCD
ncbi:hypothetical protein ABPG75_009492 [Micractinium tetrahymenae]